MENQTIVLNEKTVAVLKELRATVMTAQKTINDVNSRMTDILTGICLSEGVDLATQLVNLSEDLETLTVSNAPVAETVPAEAKAPARNTIKARRRKM